MASRLPYGSVAGAASGGWTTVEDARAEAAVARAERRFDDARRVLETALAKAQGQGAAAPEVAIELGEVLVECGEISVAGDLFESVARHAEHHHRPDLLARAALGFAAGLTGFEVRLADERQTMLLEQADRALDGEVSAAAAYVKARLSVALSFVEDPDRRKAMADDAVDIAERAGDPGAIAHALAARCDAIAGPDHTDERLALSDRIIDLGRQAQQHELALLGRRFQVVALLERGDLTEVDRSIAAFRRETSRYGSAAVRWYLPLWHAMRAAMRGDIDLALEQVAEAEAIGREADSDNAYLLVGTLRFGIGLLTGVLDPDVEAMARTSCSAEVARTGRTSARAMLLALALYDGDRLEASRHLRLLDAADFGVRDSEWLGTLAFCAEAAVDLGDADIQRVVRGHLERYDGRLIVDGIAAGVLGSVHEYLGALDLSLDGDRTRLEEAIADYRRMGAPLFEQRARARVPAEVAMADATDARVARPFAALEGDAWRFSYDGVSCVVRDGKGVRDIVRLLGRPDIEVHVSELASTAVGSSSTPIALLDDVAKRAYRQRVTDLQEEIEDAEAAHDTERASRGRVELDFVMDELRRATGLGGRDRTIGDDQERARQAVRARIRHGIRRIAEHHPVLARHLDRSIRTGTFCCYAPDAPTEWTVSR